MSSIFKIATWNVNSLRVRIAQLLAWLAEHQPDIIVLQETKIEDKDFPVAELAAAGYQVVYSGQKSYNGVAILSRQPLLEMTTDIPNLDDHQRRILAATCGDLRIVNLYVPNGAGLDSDKYPYKLNWLAQVQAYLQQQLTLYPRLLVLGDFNIAPEDRDVYDPGALIGQVLVSEPERVALNALMAVGLHDAFRLFEQAEGHYSWWDYRAGAFRRNHGLRIDHILVSKALVPFCTACTIDKTLRSADRPSDHAPVIASFLFNNA